MYKIARFGHLFGLALFLGSVLSFAAASGVPAAGDLKALAVARQVISAGTTYVTLPGLALLMISGACLISIKPAFRQPWARVMIAAGLLIVGNTVLLVLPAVGAATRLALTSARSGELMPGYAGAYMTESMAGGGNILLALGATIAGIYRFGAGAAGASEQGGPPVGVA